MNKVLCGLIFAFLSLSFARAADFSKEAGLLAKHGFGIIPEPQKVDVHDFTFALTPSTALYLDGKEQDHFSLTCLQERIRELTGLELQVSDHAPETNAIILHIVPGAELAAIPAGHARLEGYTLEVTRERILIRAAYSQGLFYGVQSLLQLVQWNGKAIPGMQVTDWPDMEFRAVHISCWFRLDRPWYYEHIFEQLSRYKINAVVFEFEDKFQYTSHPVLAAPEALSAEQVRSMIQFANQRFIEVVPLVQTLGHVAFIAKHQEFAALREVPMSNWQLCPQKAGTQSLIKDLLEEMIAATPGTKYFHIGGDEARELGQGTECKARWGDRAAVESYRMWLELVCSVLKKHGRVAIVWDDMFLRHFTDSDLQNLPDNLIYMRWNYDTGEFPKKEARILRRGYPVWIATSAQTMTPIFPDENRRIYNNANLIPSAFSLGVRGVLNTAWEDAGVHPETFWMGFLCSAEYSWSTRSPTVAEFRNKFFRLFYGQESSDLSKAYDILSRKGFVREESSWTPEFAALKLPPLPDDNFRVHSSWREANRLLVGEAQQRALEYQEASEIIDTNLQRNIHNRFNLEVLKNCAETLKHFADLILKINLINENLMQAERDHTRDDNASAVNRYQEIGRTIDDLLFEQQELYKHTEAVWEKSSYPKDFRQVPGGRARWVHQIDRDFYYANKTMDLSYIFEVENKLGLFAYQQSLYGILVKVMRGNTPW